MSATSPNHASIEAAPDTTTLPLLPELPLSETFTPEAPDVQSGTATTKLAIKQVRATENQAITRVDDHLDDEINWNVW